MGLGHNINKHALTCECCCAEYTWDKGKWVRAKRISTITKYDIQIILDVIFHEFGHKPEDNTELVVLDFECKPFGKQPNDMYITYTVTGVSVANFDSSTFEEDCKQVLHKMNRPLAITYVNSLE